jgi:N-hydroxyarylamine O-acetyltransferase
VNGLLYEALQQLGFQCYFISCSVFNHLTQAYAPYFWHVAIIVENKDGLWLTDVGFGSSFPEPLKIAYDVPQAQEGIQYKLTPLNGTEILLERSEDGTEFLKMYKFTLEPRKLQDFQEMCVFHQTSPLSPFTQRKIYSLAKPNGRITLTSQALIITENGQKTETPIADDKEFQQKLLEYFGLDEKTIL